MAILAVASTTHAIPYSVTDLGDGAAYGLNNNASPQIVGSSTVGVFANTAVVWNRPDPTQPWIKTGLGVGHTSQAFAVNNAGQIVGWAFFQGGAFLWQGGSHTALNDVNGDGTTGDLGWMQIESARDINSAGMIVGWGIESSGGPRRGFILDGNSLSSSSITTIPFSNAYGVNDANLVVGEDWHAYLYDHSTATVIDLGTYIGGLEYGGARCINEDGQVVGYASLGPPLVNKPRAFLLTPADVDGDGDLDWYVDANGDNANDLMVNLGLIAERDDGGAGSSEAWAINALGQVVGWSTHRDSTELNDYHAFLWSNGELMDLNTLIPPESGWELLRAYDINDEGYIVGQGIHDGDTRAFLLAPSAAEIPEPATLTLLALGGLGLLRRRRGKAA